MNSPREEKGIAVVGSSNLTLAGISHNTELNVLVHGNANHEALAAWFEELWDEESGFSGLVPAGWTDEALPQNYRRGLTALDPTTLVQDAIPMTADELLGLLAKQLGFDPGLESVASAESGSLVWDFYSFEYQSYRADLALTEGGDKAYFVLLISPRDERDALYETVFLPVVDALAPLE
jgi:hypothetical protein